MSIWVSFMQAAEKEGVAPPTQHTKKKWDEADDLIII
jgi:hypothetical protein